MSVLELKKTGMEGCKKSVYYDSEDDKRDTDSSYSYEETGLNQATFSKLGNKALETTVTQTNPKDRLLPYGKDLNLRIITADLVPANSIEAGSSPIEIRIVDDDRIAINNGEPIKFINDRISIFNSMMLLRDEPRAVSEYARLAHYRDNALDYDIAFSKRVLRTVRSLNEHAGLEVIKMTGKKASTKYVVNQNVVLVDERRYIKEFTDLKPYSELTETKPRAENTSKPKRVYSASGKKPTAKPRQRRQSYLPIELATSHKVANFDNYLERRQAFTDILTDYREHPRVNQLLQAVELPKDDGLASISTLRVKPKNYFPSYRRLDTKEIINVFKVIEQGLCLYQELDGKKPDIRQADMLAEFAAAHSVVYSCNLGLVFSLIRKQGRTPKDLYYDDILQEGLIGLDESIRRYQYQRGIAFSTYATTWISQSLSRADYRIPRTIKLPHEQSQQWIKYKNAVKILNSELKREPTFDELLSYTGYKSLELIKLISLGSPNIASLNTLVSDESTTEQIDLIADPVSKNSSEEPLFYAPSLHIKIEKMIKEADILPKAELILGLRYGIYMPHLDKTVLSYRGETFTYGEFIDQLHSNGGEVSEAEVASILGMQEDSVKSSIKKSIEKIHASALSEELAA